MLKVVVLNFIRDLLDDPLTRKVFCDVIALRQRCFMPVNPKILMLDPTDLIAAHLVLYQGERIVGATRLVASSTCEALGQEMSVKRIIRAKSPEHARALADFESRAGDAIWMSALCVDPGVRYHAHGSPVTEGLHYLVAAWIFGQGQANLFGLSNRRFKGTKWLGLMGLWPAHPDVEHPMAPGDPHELVLMHPIRKAFVDERDERFGLLYREAEVRDGTPKPKIPDTGKVAA